jgi:hypothetical protein
MPAAKQAIGAGIKGLGQAATDFIPGVEKGNALSSYGQSVIDANPTAIRSLGDIADKPLKAITEATGNAGGSMASMLGARGVGMAMTAAAPFTGPAAPIVAGAGQLIANVGPFVAAALPSYGGIRGSQIAADPLNEQDGRSKAIALLGAGTVGAIEGSFGPQAWALAAMKKGGIEAVAKNFAAAKSLPGFIGKGALKGAAVEGAEELVQNPVEQIASYQDPTTGENFRHGASAAQWALSAAACLAAAWLAFRMALASSSQQRNSSQHRNLSRHRPGQWARRQSRRSSPGLLMLRQCSRPCKTRRHSTNSKPSKPNRKGRRMSKKQRKGRLQRQDRAFQAHLLDLQAQAQELERHSTKPYHRQSSSHRPTNQSALQSESRQRR